MSELADLRLAIAARRRSREAARCRRNDIEIDLLRIEQNLAVPNLDPVTRAQFTRDRDAIAASLTAATAEVESAGAAYRAARSTYDAAVGDEPALWESGGDLPLLLLPVRLEAIFADVDDRTELWLRVYPDDIHVDAHETALTAGERNAGEQYWSAVEAAGDDEASRAAAWQAVLDALGPSRAAWALEALRPGNAPPLERPGSWTRAAHTALLPDRFVFSAYKDGALAWRHEGRPVPDVLPIGFAPDGGGAAGPPDGLPWDEHSRWLVDFEEAVRIGMGRRVRLTHPEETYDLLTVVGVMTADDPDETAGRWQGTLRAHQFTDGLAVLPPGTPTNNTPATRSGWRTRPGPRSPEEIDDQRVRYDPAGDQPAARAARAFGIDGRAVLAAAPEAVGGDEHVVAEVHAALGKYFGLSFIWRPLDTPDNFNIEPESVDMSFLSQHFADHVRGRGPLPTIRSGRQPYGLLPVTALDLWRGDDVDARILEHLESFLTAFEVRLDRVPRVGDGADQDAVIVDLLSREPASRRVTRTFPNTFAQLGFEGPFPSVVGSVGPHTQFGLLGPDAAGGELMVVDDVAPEELARVARLRPLAAKVQLADDLRTTTREGAPDVFARFDVLRTALAPLERWSGEGTAYTGDFYPFGEDVSHYLFNLAGRAHVDNEPSEAVEAARRQFARVKEVCDLLVGLEERAAEDIGSLERTLCEVLDTVSHRVDAWATSVSSARLAGLRAEHPSGLRVGAYGWLTEVGHGHGDPGSEGYVVTPSLHHATTAAVLRSGWRAHTDRRALAVDLQSWRVRTALALVDGVRTGQSLAALLGYQFERGLHDAHLDQHIAGFRTDFPLPLAVEPDAPGSTEARVAIGARNVVDGQALRRRRPNLGPFRPEEARVIGELLDDLDEAVDAVGDLLLAESVHHLVGGNPLRAGMSADAIGRGDGLPEDFDVIRTPRSAATVTHHVGLLGSPEGAGAPAGWNDDRPLAELEPALEAWLRHRLGRADADWSFACRVADEQGNERGVDVLLASLEWSAFDVVTAGQPVEGGSPLIRRILDVAAGLGGLRGPNAVAGHAARLTEEGMARADELVLLCGQFRSVLAAGTPLLATHIDPSQPSGWATADLDDLHARVAPWLDAIRDAREVLRDAAAEAPEAIAAALEGLATLGLMSATPTPGADVAEHAVRVLARLDAVALPPLPPPPTPGGREAIDSLRWAMTATTAVTSLVGEHLKVVPVLRPGLPGAGAPPRGAEGDAVADWLRAVADIRPAAASLVDAVTAGSLVGGADEGSYAVVQMPGRADRHWVATANTGEAPTTRASIVLHHDGLAAGPAVAGLVLDGWTEAIPRPAGPDGPEEVAGVAFGFDRPGSRAPHALLVAVPPDRSRGWREEDVHGVVEETLTLARIRTLDLRDIPELRTILPMPGAESA